MNENIIIAFLDENGEAKHSVNSSALVNNPYEFNLESFLPNEKPMTLTSFFELVSSLISDAQTKEGRSFNVPLVEEYPPENISDYGEEVITFKVVERKPGLMNTKGTSRPQRKKMHYYEYMDEKYPNKVVTVESRPVDHIIELCCWATNNNLANKRALWLEKLMINCSFVFEINGAERFYWKDRKSDTYMTSGNQRIFYRQLHFFLRLREFDAKINSTLRNILIESGIIPAN